MAVIAAPVGLIVGAVAGYVGGWIDRILMGITDIFLSMPKLILALAFVAALGAGHRERDHRHRAHRLAALCPHRAGRDADLPQLRIHRRRGAAGRVVHAASCSSTSCRSALSSMIIRVTLDMAGIILTAAGLGFLGLGAQPPLPEWGAMISRGRSYILDQWWVATMPGFAIILVSLGFCFLGDGLRDVLDPKHGGNR